MMNNGNGKERNILQTPDELSKTNQDTSEKKENQMEQSKNDKLISMVRKNSCQIKDTEIQVDKVYEFSLSCEHFEIKFRDSVVMIHDHPNKTEIITITMNIVIWKWKDSDYSVVVRQI